MSTVDIDIGNTRIKARSRGATAVEVCPHGGAPAATLARMIPAHATLNIAHVFGEAAEAGLRHAAETAGAKAVRFARTHGDHSGLRLAYEQPARMGVDRFLAMLALWRELQNGFLVASAGTALTVDIVDDQGKHQGGFIAPGLHAMRGAVLDRTQFPHAFDAPAHDRPGTDTESCVSEAALGAALGLLERTQQRYGTRGIISGGDATSLHRFLPQAHWQLRDHLVLDGLAALGDE